MAKKQYLFRDVTKELQHYFKPPRTTLNSLAVNSLISVAFFLGSYWLGTYNPALLPIAAATILFWTLADTSVSNQFLFDKHRATAVLKSDGTLQHYLLVKNIAIAILTIPLTLVFGLLIVALTGKWSEILYGVVVAFTLVWGWLGISNALSAVLPFELVDIKSYMKNKRIWLPYGFLYVLPWVLLPVYAILMSLPFVLLGWTKGNAALDHSIASVAILLILSISIWILGLRIADKYAARRNSKVKQLLLDATS